MKRRTVRATPSFEGPWLMSTCDVVVKRRRMNVCVKPKATFCMCNCHAFSHWIWKRLRSTLYSMWDPFESLGFRDLYKSSVQTKRWSNIFVWGTALSFLLSRWDQAADWAQFMDRVGFIKYHTRDESTTKIQQRLTWFEIREFISPIWQVGFVHSLNSNRPAISQKSKKLLCLVSGKLWMSLTGL